MSMLPVPDAVAAKLPHLPESPGVYLWQDKEGKTLYVGKAKRLRSRVRSYFANDDMASVKTRHMVGLIADVDTIVAERGARADPRGEPDQGVPPAVQHRAARRQVVSVHQGHGAGELPADLRDATDQG